MTHEDWRDLLPEVVLYTPIRYGTATATCFLGEDGECEFCVGFCVSLLSSCACVLKVTERAEEGEDDDDVDE